MQRKLYVFQGDSDWCKQSALKSLRGKVTENVVWLGNDASVYDLVIPQNKAKTLLGKSTGIVVFDATDQFNPDAFGAITGTIAGGGCLIILFQPRHFYASRFLKRFFRLLAGNEQVFWVRQGDILPDITVEQYVNKFYDSYAEPTDEQQIAIHHIKQVVSGHRNRPLVITADRGRGKSAALGLAVRELIEAGLTNIYLTAPAKSTVATVYEHAFPDEKLEAQSSLIFLSPDEILRQSPKVSLLLIDEAAAIPVFILTELLKRYSRIVFSTTQHGYEGSGKGFSIRFKQVLSRLTPEWKSLHLSQPIRWAENDYLEDFVNQSLLLDADLSSLEEKSKYNSNKLVLQKIEQDDLLENDELLRSLFGLLVSAHYQTKPSDFAFMLDEASISVHAVQQHNKVIAVLLSEEEGGFSHELAHQIFAGERRVKGHLVPQSLAFHSGLPIAAEMRCQRVIRIAVHPSFQGKGLGSQIIDSFVQQYQSRVDYIGVSFACTQDVLAFWRKCEFIPVRLGLKKEAATGIHSLIMLKPVTERGEQLVQQAIQRFKDNFYYQLQESFQDISPDLVIALLSAMSGRQPQLLLEDDIETLQSFVLTNRGYELCLASIYRFVRLCSNSSFFNVLEPKQQHLLIRKVLQKQTWKGVASELKYTGRKEAEKELKEAVGTLMYSQEKNIKGV
jgi:tRNA(Met) cytidine acetyltransferase